MGAAAATYVRAAATTTMAAPPAAAATAVPAASRRNSYALAEARLGLPIEHMKGRQTDVRDFLLAEKDPTCVSCDVVLVGAVADAPPVMARDTPAAPNAKAALPAFRFGLRLAFAI
jgi:hypothetical protein